MSKESPRKPGEFMPESGMTEEEWRRRNWFKADEDAERSEVKARAGYGIRNEAHHLKQSAKELQDIADSEHPLLHLSKDRRQWSRLRKARTQRSADQYTREAKRLESDASWVEDNAGWDYNKEQRDAAERVVRYESDDPGGMLDDDEDDSAFVE